MNVSNKNSKQQLKDTDVEFSNYCLKHGMKKAFYQYASDNAVMLRENSYPIVGRENIRELFEERNENSFEFSWQPIDADVANSGELGYTYGTYKIKTSDTLLEGTYVSIWKQNAKGEWKYVLDSGNEGLGK